MGGNDLSLDFKSKLYTPCFNVMLTNYIHNDFVI